MKNNNKELEIKLTLINNYSFDFLKERLLVEETLLKDEEEIDIAIDEFKKFLTLIAMDIKPLAMISPKVDEVWHQFILFTDKYELFCNEIMGKFIHHKPNTITDPVPLLAIKNIISGYQSNFGEIPNFWFEELDNESILYFKGKKNNIIPLKWSGWTG